MASYAEFNPTYFDTSGGNVNTAAGNLNDAISKVGTIINKQQELIQNQQQFDQAQKLKEAYFASAEIKDQEQQDSDAAFINAMNLADEQSKEHDRYQAEAISIQDRKKELEKARDKEGKLSKENQDEYDQLTARGNEINQKVAELGQIDGFSTLSAEGRYNYALNQSIKNGRAPSKAATSFYENLVANAQEKTKQRETTEAANVADFKKWTNPAYVTQQVLAMMPKDTDPSDVQGIVRKIVADASTANNDYTKLGDISQRISQAINQSVRNPLTGYLFGNVATGDLADNYKSLYAQQEQPGIIDIIENRLKQLLSA